jgi:hypothetical protein
MWKQAMSGGRKCRKRKRKVGSGARRMVAKMITKYWTSGGTEK